MKPPIWLSRAVVLAIHGELLAEHGGSEGVRDVGLLESALARPSNLLSYDTPTLFDMAAAYAYGIAKNHPFVDGNKRTALACCDVFLQLNGFELNATEPEATTTFLALASGSLTEAELAHWISQHTVQMS